MSQAPARPAARPDAPRSVTLPGVPVEAPPVALYVHVPFCISLCPYCDFVVYAGATARGPSNRIASFVDALATELRLRADALDARWPDARAPLESLYFGGGTPSLLPVDAVAELIGLVGERFGVAANAEITLEANPGPDDRGDAAAFARAGVNRISFGAQSLDEEELRRLGRRHRPADVADAVAAAREGGIGSVNVDLLYDIPGGSTAIWTASLDAALGLAPDHLSLYALTLDDPDAEGITGAAGDHLPTTAGARRWRTRARADQDDDLAAEQYVHAVDRLAADGWRGYEISNWARPGHESRHNVAYWTRRSYEAVGPGAHAFDGSRRRWNGARLDAYVAALGPGAGGKPRLPPGGADVLDGDAAAAEAVILGLRTDRGLPAVAAGEAPLAGSFGWATSNGLLAMTADDRIVLTTRGRLLSNELFARVL
jgi:putative oxygen-independent coproporphyrinogen III oxidase